jgi:FtsH-binding integral membrane protein
MVEGLFYAGSVLVPLVFGLVPAFLPLRSPFVLRWGLWLAALGLTAWYGHEMDAAPAAYRLVAWATVIASALLSFIVLATDTGWRRRER